MPDTPSQTGTWLYWALLTVGCWGVYGVFLHSGAVGMDDDDNGRIKAFLWVGLAYFLTAVLAPLVILKLNGADLDFWNYKPKGLWWSLIAGILGAIGALGVLLAFGAKGSPAVVMSIIFAGAPIVNAVVAISLNPPVGGWSGIDKRFFLGILCAAIGGYLVTKHKPPPSKTDAAKKPPTEQIGADPKTAE